MFPSIVLFLLPCLIYGRFLNLQNLLRFQEIATQLLNFSHGTAEYSFEAFGRTFHLDLERNSGLLHPNYREYTWENGRVREKLISTSPSQHCYYHGHVRGEEKSSVAVSICEGLNGLIRAFGEDYVIHPTHLTSLATAAASLSSGLLHPVSVPHGFPFLHYHKHVVFPQKDLQLEEVPTCGVVHPGEHPQDISLISRLFPLRSRQQRRLFQTDSPRYVELLAVNDFARFQDYQYVTENETLNIANVADSCYRDSDFSPYPISVVLVAQITFQNGDPYSATSAGGGEVVTADLLNSFLDWAYNDIQNLPSHDSHLLVSGLDFQGSTVGLAPVGGMCEVKNSGAITQAKGFDSSLAGATMAHEMGHTLNMQHDGTADATACPPTGFVMQAIADASAPAATQFSSCSISAYLSWVTASSQSSCLINVPTVRWGDGVCGNGIVETGEQCDCGNDTSCTSDPCCNGKICRLQIGAQYQCSSKQVCCQSNCGFKPQSANFLCRVASGDGCDANEYCNGQSGDCPTSNFKTPGSKCTDQYGATGACYDGGCHTWLGRCRSTSASYNACPNQDYNASLPICARQYCTTDGTDCFAVNGTTPDFEFAEDGVLCNDNSHQCLSGQCLPSSSLYKDLDPNNPNNWGGIDVPIDVNMIVTYAAIALGIGLLLSCFWRMCCNRQKRIVYVSRIRNRGNQQIAVQQQIEGQPDHMQVQQIPAGREGQGAVDVGGGLVLEFGGRSGTAILPPGWSSHYTSDGRPYWYHAARGETSWTFPTQ